MYLAGLIADGSGITSDQTRGWANTANGSKIVNRQGVACKVPSIVEYIGKVNKMGRTGQKRKTAKC